MQKKCVRSSRTISRIFTPPDRVQERVSRHEHEHPFWAKPIPPAGTGTDTRRFITINCTKNGHKVKDMGNNGDLSEELAGRSATIEKAQLVIVSLRRR
jgi:hypothetical protein